jgi:hypothetical protein
MRTTCPINQRLKKERLLAQEPCPKCGGPLGDGTHEVGTPRYRYCLKLCGFEVRGELPRPGEFPLGDVLYEPFREPHCCPLHASSQAPECGWCQRLGVEAQTPGPQKPAAVPQSPAEEELMAARALFKKWPIECEHENWRGDPDCHEPATWRINLKTSLGSAPTKWCDSHADRFDVPVGVASTPSKWELPYAAELRAYETAQLPCYCAETSMRNCPRHQNPGG